MKYVSWNDYKAVPADLKQIYRSALEAGALQELNEFAERRDGKYPQISRS